MPVIQKLILDTTDLPRAGATRRFTILGDPGSVFSFYISNENNRDGTNKLGSYYNFGTRSFQTGFVSLENIEMPRNGVYKNSIVFPSVSDDDQYDAYLVANPHYGTTLSLSLVTKGFIYHVPNADQSTNTDGSLKFPSSIYQLTNKTVNIYVNHDGDSDIKYEADATGSGSATLGTLTLPAGVITDESNILNITHSFADDVGNIVGTDSSQVLSITNHDNFDTPEEYVAINQYESSYGASTTFGAEVFYAQITKVVNGATTDSTSVVLDDVDNLAVGFVLQTTSSGTIPTTKPTITNIDKASKTLTLSAACSLADDATLTFRGYGNIGSQTIQDLSFSVTNGTVRLTKIDDYYNVKTSTTAEFVGGTSITVASTAGVKANNYINASGLGLTSGAEQIKVASVTNATTLVVSGAQATDEAQDYEVLEDVTIFFAGSSQKAIITVTVTVTSADQATSNLYLDLTKFLTLTDNF